MSWLADMEAEKAREKGMERLRIDLARMVTHPRVAMSEDRATQELVEAARLLLAGLRLGLGDNPPLDYSTRIGAAGEALHQSQAALHAVLEEAFARQGMQRVERLDYLCWEMLRDPQRRGVLIVVEGLDWSAKLSDEVPWLTFHEYPNGRIGE